MCTSKSIDNLPAVTTCFLRQLKSEKDNEEVSAHLPTLGRQVCAYLSDHFCALTIKTKANKWKICIISWKTCIISFTGRFLESTRGLKTRETEAKREAMSHIVSWKLPTRHPFLRRNIEFSNAVHWLSMKPSICCDSSSRVESMWASSSLRAESELSERAASSGDKDAGREQADKESNCDRLAVTENVLACKSLSLDSAFCAARHSRRTAMLVRALCTLCSLKNKIRKFVKNKKPLNSLPAISAMTYICKMSTNLSCNKVHVFLTCDLGVASTSSALPGKQVCLLSSPASKSETRAQNAYLSHCTPELNGNPPAPRALPCSLSTITEKSLALSRTANKNLNLGVSI